VAGLAVAVVGAGVHLSSRREIEPALRGASLLPYCEDIVTEIMPSHDAVIVGGLAIDAFNYKYSVIDVDKRSITVDSGFESLLLRKNGTVRDYDVLVIGRDELGRPRRLPDETQKKLKERTDAATKKRAQSLNQPAPIMSIFSFDDHRSLPRSATIVSGDGRISMEHGFVSQLLPETAMDKWSLTLPEGITINILNPWEQYWRSMVRFSSGMKNKDAEKIGLMLKRLQSTDGLAEMENQELSSAYRSFHDQMLAQNSLTAVMESLQAPNRDWEHTLKLGELVVTSKVMAFGQKFETVNRIVQGTPKVFNSFVGSK
jgi:hypothetical protein